MTDKVQKIREEVKRIINRRLNLLYGDYYFDLNKETEGFTNEIMDTIDSLQEESTSEDLEEAAADYENNMWEAGHSEDTYTSTDIIRAVKFGAKWQKEKDEEEKVLTYKHGFEDCKERMMAKAVDAQCFGFQGAALFSFKLPADKYLVGSEVKVIVIKED